MRATVVLMIMLAAYMATLFAQIANDAAWKKEASAVCTLAPHQGRYLTCGVGE